MTLADRITFLWPEIILFAFTCWVMMLGLSRHRATRKLCAPVSGVALIIAALVAWKTTPGAGQVTANTGQLLLPGIVMFAKVTIAAVGLLMLLLLAGTVDRADEERIAARRLRFDPLSSNRAEFYSFFLFSMTGLMLCASADDLIWLFLALELTSLPTYIMVTMSGGAAGAWMPWRNKSQEAGVKYFFLGALGAAIFLYGFALIYGGTGSTNLNVIREHFQNGGVNTLSMTGMLLAIVGLGFKIASVPMHFYAADVYEGAAAPVSAFLAFTPKTAGFLGIILLCATMGWGFAPSHTAGGVWVMDPQGGSLPEPIRLTLWVIAALTMTIGNVLAIQQNSIKRLLAYSSIAHSGYMLVGVIAGPGDGTFTKNGLAAVLFYLLAYGVMNLGAFAVVAVLERSSTENPDEPREIETVDELRGLCRARPVLGWTMAISALSLLGLPPLLGFFGKAPLFTSAISAGETVLVVVLGINSAIAAFYYLRLVRAVMLEDPDAVNSPLSESPFRSRRLAGVLSMIGILVLPVAGNKLMSEATTAAAFEPAAGAHSGPESAPQAHPAPHSEAGSLDGGPAAVSGVRVAELH
ncbi:MAG: NADH-quinone oxidoreductase subunit N [Phycisphaerales bacterium]|nr:NADH-quinone oxidoreductase subunit N [Phycisphaerales bacterium]